MRAGSGEAARLGFLATSLFGQAQIFEQAQILAQPCTAGRPGCFRVQCSESFRMRAALIIDSSFDPAALNSKQYPVKPDGILQIILHINARSYLMTRSQHLLATFCVAPGARPCPRPAQPIALPHGDGRLRTKLAREAHAVR